MNKKEILEQEVRNLQCDLTASDYKVIKCYEAKLVGEPLPYDKDMIHVDRQAIRDRINELQEIIDEIPDDQIEEVVSSDA